MTSLSDTDGAEFQPVDLLALGLRDEMTDWEQLGMEYLQC